MERGFNLSSIMNKTKEFDPFCTELLTGLRVWATLSLLFVSYGAPASVWLLSVLIQRRREGLANDIYMLNLTIMDLIFNINVILCVINYFFWHDYVFWLTADCIYCFSVAGRPLFMASTCVDCYIAVVHPITYMKMKESKYRLVASVLVWSFTLSYGLFFVRAKQPLFSNISLIFFAFCLTTIIFCDGAMLYTLRKPDPAGRSDIHPQKQRALQIITNSMIMTLVSYLPPMVVFGFGNLFETILSPQEVFCSIGFLAYISSTFGSTIMPLLHLGSLGKLKDLMTLSVGCTKRA